ncbi:hypothetical protein BZA70DRAFT_278977 [Myxozyma melibiosi]|uniref:SEP domain-containing protein n=1 Tax=Myxozyma melibiosi TaxID=54550 RepID=A0ABR1F5E2_9ASCO
MDAEIEQQNARIAKFAELTQATAEDARKYLDVAAWNLDYAVDLFFSSGGEGPGDADVDEEENDDDDDDAVLSDFPSATPARPTEQTLGSSSLSSLPSSDRHQHQQSPAAMSAADRAKRAAAAANRVRTLADLNKESSPAHDDDSDEGSSYGRAFGRRREDLFTGGEKSGLAVQNPDGPSIPEPTRLVSNILSRAERGGRAPEAEEARPAQRFYGSGHVLGAESSPAPASSSATAAASASPAAEEDLNTPVTRTLTFWRDGFTIENGELMAYDDPVNQEILRAIDGGRAPLHLLNVRPGQAVDMRVERRMNDDYEPPMPAGGGFHGKGFTLGG